MSKKLCAALLPILAVAAFASMTGAAQAVEPRWEICKHEATATHKFSDSECQKEVANTGNWEWVAIPNGEANKVQVITFGTLTLTTNTGIVITCKVLDAGNIWNLAAGGLDNIEVFINYECKSTSCANPTVTAKGLPWTTELAAGPIDKIKGIEITVNCTAVVPFTGELKPKIVNSTETEPTIASFTAATGELKDPAEPALTAKVEGSDRILGFTHGEDVRVK